MLFEKSCVEEESAGTTWGVQGNDGEESANPPSFLPAVQGVQAQGAFPTSQHPCGPWSAGGDRSFSSPAPGSSEKQNQFLLAKNIDNFNRRSL